MRRAHALIAALWLCVGAFVLLYAGPGRELVRGSLGDVMVVPFLVHALGLLWPAHHRARIVGVGLLALGVELLQLAELAGPHSPWWVHLTLGSTFDPWDLLGYGLGLVLAALTMRWLVVRGVGGATES